MATLYTQQSQNVMKTWFLMGIFFSLFIAVGFGFSWYFDNSFILYAVIAVTVATSIWSYWFSHKVVLRMTNAEPADPHRHRTLIDVVENLSITAGLPMPQVYVIDDPSPNAFATGRNPENAVVAATTGLLEILDRTELEGVMAHELAHVGNRDMLVMTVAVVLAGSIAVIADFFMHMLIFGGDERKHPLFLVLAIIGIILAPFAAQLIQMAVSRKREYLADATGALLTRYPEGLASALEKISGSQRPMERASHATAHLFISDPFAGMHLNGFKAKINQLYQTHPPVEERISRLRSMGTVQA